MALPTKSPGDFGATGTYTAANFNDQINPIYTWGQGEVDVHIAATTAHGATGSVMGTTNTQTATNKTLTTPVIAEIYQDVAKTKLMSLPDTASDTLAAIAATQTFTNKTITSGILKTAMVMQQTTANATWTWSDFAAARAISVPDPLGDVKLFFTAQEIMAGSATVAGGKTSVLCSTAGITVTLPTAALANDGFRITIKDISGGAGASPITIVGEGGETIDNVAAGVQIVEDNGEITVEAYNTKWWIVEG